MEPLEYFRTITATARDIYKHPPTWAHVLLASLDHAKRYSSYGHEPGLEALRNALRSRTLAKLGKDAFVGGLSDEDLIDAAKSLQDFERNKSELRFVQDRVLRWLSDFPQDVRDWTLAIWNELLDEFQVTAEHFGEGGEWGGESTEAEDGEKGLDWRGELEALVGLEDVKRDVRRLSDFLRIRQVRQQRGFEIQGFTLHQVFLGNPGTGKTSVARILAKVYREFGFLSKGHLVETDRSGLVGQYIGATEAKTEATIRKALGGVLFIDEAYSLAGNGNEDFGPRAIDTLVKMMEDHRKELVVIVAGYSNEMHDFLESNPGLSSRFPRVIDFPDYSQKELDQILRLLAEKESFSLSGHTTRAAVASLSRLKKKMKKHFGNAREVRNLWERMLMNQAMRLSRAHPDMDLPDKALLEILPEDIEQDQE